MAENNSVQMDSGSTGTVPPESQQPGTQQDNEGNQRPEWLPEKFSTPAEMAKAYSELEAKLGQNQSQPDESDQNTEPSSSDSSSENETGNEGPYYSEAIDSALNNAGVDPSEVQKEFAENQQLGDETYSKLEQAGYPREMVDAYIKGLQADAQANANSHAQEIMSEVGGKETYNEITQWAANNLSAQEVEDFNKAVESGTEAAKWAVRGLYSRYRSSEGVEPSRSLSGSTSSTPTDTFTSTQQVVEAMKDSRYQNDPGFRKQIQDKLQRSNVF